MARLVRKVMPLNVVQQRRHTEEIVRGMFQRYRCTSLEVEFQRNGVEKHEADVLFDEIDLRYGEALASFDVKRTEPALNAAFLMIAGFVMEKQGFNR